MYPVAGGSNLASGLQTFMKLSKFEGKTSNFNIPSFSVETRSFKLRLVLFSAWCLKVFETSKLEFLWHGNSEIISKCV